MGGGGPVTHGENGQNGRPGLSATRFGPGEEVSISGNRIRLVDVVVLCLLVLASSLLLGWNARQFFDFFDCSAFVDAGYRVYSGQEPYVDFYYTAGPVHLWMHALFFALFGFGQTALVAHLLAVNAVVIMVTFAVSRRELGLLVSALVTALTALCFYGPVSHPWYDQNAVFWFVLAVFLVEYWPRKRHVGLFSLRDFLCGVLVGLSFLTKANVGLAGGAVLFALMLVARPWLGRLLSYCCGAFLLFLAALLALDSPREFLFQNFVAYDSTSRLADAHRFLIVLLSLPYTYLCLVVALLCVLGGIPYLRQNLFRLLLLAGLLGISIGSAFSGSMLPRANIPLLGLEMALLFLLAGDLGRLRAATAPPWTGWVVQGLLVVITCNLIAYALRMTLDRATWEWRSSNKVGDYVLQAPSMRGWRCNREVGEGVDRAVRYIKENLPPQERLFVFPDATIVYGLTGRDSFRPAPFIFHLGVIPFPGRIYDQFRGAFMDDPPDWILLHHQDEIDFFETEALLEWLHLDDFIAKNYRAIWRFGDFSLLQQISAGQAAGESRKGTPGSSRQSRPAPS